MLILFISACAAPAELAPASPTEISSAQRSNALNSNQPSIATLRVLRWLDLEDSDDRDTPTTLALLDSATLSTVAENSRLLAVTELSILHARRLLKSNPEKAIDYYLLASFYASAYMQETAVSGSIFSSMDKFVLVRELYNRAVVQFVVTSRKYGKWPWNGDIIDIQGRRFRLTTKSNPEWEEPGYFDELLPVDFFDVSGFRERYQRTGIGAPFVAYRHNATNSPIEHFFPPEGIVHPLTILLKFERSFENQIVDGALELHDPRDVQSIKYGDYRLPLRADFTSPYAYLLSKTDLKSLAVWGTLDFQKSEFHRGLFLLEPYNPDKTPVIMIHGLKSSPLTWMQLTNDIMGQQDLQGRYQIWHYMYPSAMPYLYTGMVLREELSELRQLVDPQGRHDASQNMVLIGHSLGGLVTKTLVTDSGSILWDTTFLVPPDTLPASEEDIEHLKNMFVLNAQDYVGRAIFIGTPNRGSEVASMGAAKFLSKRIKLPQNFTGPFERIEQEAPDVIVPSMRDAISDGGPSSMRTLQPDHPLLLKLANLPVADDIPFHLIIGSIDPESGREISDGYVSYKSAYLEGATSEYIAPVGHTKFGDPEVIREIIRILRLHPLR